jgi:hypothetical protein
MFVPGLNKPPKTKSMNCKLIFFIVLFSILGIIIILSIYYDLLRDQQSVPDLPKPYSFSWVQLTWWTFIVLGCICTLIFCAGSIPVLDPSTLKLLGIGSLTTVSARLIDISDDANVKKAALAGQTVSLSRNEPGQDLLLDILSDKNGVSIHRLQAAILNLVIGANFLCQFFLNLHCFQKDKLTIDKVIPVLDSSTLVLLGISAGTYIALKSTENK